LAAYKGNKRFFKEFRDVIKRTPYGQSWVSESLDFKSGIVDNAYWLRKVSQIDFVPTIADLLGVPIPFSSLGMIIPEFTLLARNETPQITEKCLLALHQVMQYITKV
jgi:hypothetical protein